MSGYAHIAYLRSLFAFSDRVSSFSDFQRHALTTALEKYSTDSFRRDSYIKSLLNIEFEIINKHFDNIRDPYGESYKALQNRGYDKLRNAILKIRKEYDPEWYVDPNNVDGIEEIGESISENINVAPSLQQRNAIINRVNNRFDKDLEEFRIRISLVCSAMDKAVSPMPNERGNELMNSGTFIPVIKTLYSALGQLDRLSKDYPDLLTRDQQTKLSNKLDILKEMQPTLGNRTMGI